MQKKIVIYIHFLCHCSFSFLNISKYLRKTSLEKTAEYAGIKHIPIGNAKRIAA